jgi:hypothetical protein
VAGTNGQATRPAPPARGVRWPVWVLVVALIAAYPAITLGYVYAHTMRSELPGGRHGPRDAYRHALASAFVAYTLSPRVVDWVTEWMEGHGPSSEMDRHNNAIGARIGAAATALAELRTRVRAAVDAGAVNATDPEQITWLPRSRWRELPF